MMQIIKNWQNASGVEKEIYIPLATFIIFVVTDGIFL